MLQLFALLISIANGEECSSLQNLQDCRRIIDCFWNSREGRCAKIADYTRKEKRLSQCSSFGSLDTCYLHMDCFWVAHLGDCEDLVNWEPIYKGHVACNTIANEDSCWLVSDCFWNRHIMQCGQMPPQVESTSKPSSYLPPSTIAIKDTLPPSESPVYHPRPCLAWATEALCFQDDRCFWDRRLSVCFDVAPPSLPPFASQIASLYPVVTSTLETSAKISSTTSTTPPILGLEDPMTLCETYDEPTCRADDDCVIDEATLRCYAINDSDCNRLPSKHVCIANEDCHWSRFDHTCESVCSKFEAEGRCTLEEDCVWEEASQECLSVFSSCFRLLSPDSCVLNEVCSWSIRDSTCVSLFGPCTRHSDEARCNMAAQFNTHCEWGENPGQKDIFGCQDPFTTAPPIIECQELTDMDTCLENNETQSNMPCIWDIAKQECSVFTFDCEDFQTQEKCEAASFRDTRCFWDGECDFAEAGVLAKAHLSLQPSESAQPSVILFFLAAMLFGIMAGLGVLKLRKTHSSLEQPLHLTP